MSHKYQLLSRWIKPRSISTNLKKVDKDKKVKEDFQLKSIIKILCGNQPIEEPYNSESDNAEI